MIAARHRHAREQLVLDRPRRTPSCTRAAAPDPAGRCRTPGRSSRCRRGSRCAAGCRCASRTERLPSASFHVRVSLAAVIVLNASAKPSAADATYLLAFTLSAVLPVPNRSYAAARRTAQSCQFGTFSTAGRSRAAHPLARRRRQRRHLGVEVVVAAAEVQRQPVHRPRVLREEAEVGVHPFDRFVDRRVADPHLRRHVVVEAQLEDVGRIRAGPRAEAAAPPVVHAGLERVRAGHVARRGRRRVVLAPAVHRAGVGAGADAGGDLEARQVESGRRPAAARGGS